MPRVNENGVYQIDRVYYTDTAP